MEMPWLPTLLRCWMLRSSCTVHAGAPKILFPREPTVQGSRSILRESRSSLCRAEQARLDCCHCSLNADHCKLGPIQALACAAFMTCTWVRRKWLHKVVACCSLLMVCGDLSMCWHDFWEVTSKTWDSTVCIALKVTDIPDSGRESRTCSRRGRP